MHLSQHSSHPSIADVALHSIFVLDSAIGQSESASGGEYLRGTSCESFAGKAQILADVNRKTQCVRLVRDAAAECFCTTAPHFGLGFT